MKNKTFIWLLLLLTTVVFQSCTSDVYTPVSDSMQKRELTMNLSVDGFTEVSSRAGGLFATGDKVYIDFGGYRATAEYDGSVWTVECPDNLPEVRGGSCTVTYIEDAAFDGTSSVSLSSASVVYNATGTYTNTADEMSVTASLSPATARVHFLGAAGTSITVSGLMCYSQFSKADFGLSSQTTNITLTVGDDGYTDYVYCLFASDNRELAVVNGFTTYIRTFGDQVLKVGHGGYINIPTDENSAGWTSDRKYEDENQNVDTSVNGYDDDENWTPTIHNGHEYVDLGLSVKWATMNVGALRPDGYGHYFAWGEVYSKEYYDWSTYKWCNGSSSTMTKYCTKSSYGTVDNKTTLDPEDDVAHVKWGGSWRMPTKAEQEELRTKCTWTWTKINGVKGYEIKSKTNGNSIFLPAAGYRDDSYFLDVGSYGYYWLSSLNESGSYLAYVLYFYSNGVSWGSNYRYFGQSVRAVCP